MRCIQARFLANCPVSSYNFYLATGGNGAAFPAGIVPIPSKSTGMSDDFRRAAPADCMLCKAIVKEFTP
jgi:hypothetical protein